MQNIASKMQKALGGKGLRCTMAGFKAFSGLSTVMLR